MKIFFNPTYEMPLGTVRSDWGLTSHITLHELPRIINVNELE
jgi:hypothetical protein